MYFVEYYFLTDFRSSTWLEFMDIYSFKAAWSASILTILIFYILFVTI